MQIRDELSQDMLLSCHNIHGRKTRIHEKTEYLAKKRLVVYSSRWTTLRLWGLLPPKTGSTRDCLKIPEEITSEQELIRYVKQHRRGWLRHRSEYRQKEHK